MADPRAAGDMERRLANIIRMGVIDSVDHANARVRVRIGEILTAPVQWQTGAAGETTEWSAPSVGEQVVLLSPSGELAQGVVLRGVYSEANPAPGDRGDIYTRRFPDGSQVTWDAGTLTVKGVGKVVVDAPDVRLGSAGANDPVVRKSDLQKAVNDLIDAINNHTHPAPGGATGTPFPLLTPISAQGSDVTSSD